jgi:hypothetical protein
MASNRAIMPRADSTSSTVDRSTKGCRRRAPSPLERAADWLNNVPTDRPDVIVADGLMGFSPRTTRVPAESPHQPSPEREMAFNSETSFAVWASKVVRGTQSVAGVLWFPGVNDPQELEGWNPKLNLIGRLRLLGKPEVAEFRRPFAPRFLPTSTSLSRQGRASCITASRTGV